MLVEVFTLSNMGKLEEQTSSFLDSKHMAHFDFCPDSKSIVIKVKMVVGRDKVQRGNASLK